eukprot:5188846-Prymnesium_polylepis.1
MEGRWRGGGRAPPATRGPWGFVVRALTNDVAQSGTQKLKPCACLPLNSITGTTATVPVQWRIRIDEKMPSIDPILRPTTR